MTIPRKLRAGDTIRVVAPSSTAAPMIDQHRELRDQRFAELGLTLTYGAHVANDDDFGSAPVAERIEDLHAAFADPDVAGIITAIGGYNANQLLPYFDWELIAHNPKVFCGYSDITALQNAMLAKTGLVTYSGPHWSSFGMRDYFARTVEGFRRCVYDDAPFALEPADVWTDDGWFLDQDARNPTPNDGWWTLSPGATSGRIVGGNLCTLNLLQGTAFMPSLDDAVLFVEDDFESSVPSFTRDLHSLLQQHDAGVRGLVIGRFQRATAMTRELLAQIVAVAAPGLPVLANVDFGHTFPIATFPIGGQAEIDADRPSITITEH